MNHPATAAALAEANCSNGSSQFWGLLRDSWRKARFRGVFHMLSTGRSALLPAICRRSFEARLVNARLNAETSLNDVDEVVAIRMSSAAARITPLIEAVFRNVENSDLQVAPAPDEVAADVDALQEGFRLQRIRRFYRQRHWAPESAEADFADRAEPGLKLENVAAHSWHVADAAHLLAGHFPDLDIGRIVLLAVIHDKLEIYTGDYDPVGPEGNGSGTHAFDEAARLGKQLAEREAAKRYLSKLRPTVREWQRLLLEEAIEGTSLEARFVKAVDKLQALAYVLEKKRGQLDDTHLAFTVMYSRKALTEFPRIRFHYAELLGRFLDGVSVARGISREDLDRQVFGQLELKL